MYIKSKNYLDKCLFVFYSPVIEVDNQKPVGCVSEISGPLKRWPCWKQQKLISACIVVGLDLFSFYFFLPFNISMALIKFKKNV